MVDITGRFPTLASCFSADELRASIDAYRWRQHDYRATAQRRSELEQALTGAIADKDEATIHAAVDQIYRWGFGKPAPASCRDDRGRALLARVLTQWAHVDGIEDEEALRGLVELLQLRGVGISAASKLICFVDQRRYAIYDSRVSLALARVAVDGWRRYPIVPRRQKTTLAGDTLSVDEVARHYATFVRDLREMAAVKHLSLADAEMALFTIGGPIRSRSGRLFRS